MYPADKNIKAVHLKVVSNNIIQVLSSLNKIIQPDTSFIIVANRTTNNFTVSDDALAVSESTATIKAVVAKNTGLVSFYTKDGSTITKESVKSL